LAALTKEEKAERDAIDLEFASALQNVDRIRTEVDDCRKKAEGFYEAREAAIRKTQVHRIATTVEIVRGLFKG
jgi:tetrahydromethanopterin S-methyltransferase subunit F